MKFDKAKNLVMFMLVMCIIVCVGSIIANDFSLELANMFGLLSALFFILAIIVIAVFCKCPHCGKRIFLGLFKYKTCPNCRHDLVTGEKTKGKKR